LQQPQKALTGVFPVAAKGVIFQNPIVPFMRFTFKRGERLRSETVIQNLFESGNKGFKYPFRYSFLLISRDDVFPVSVLFVVPKRKIPLAVQRNLIRRRMREAFRQNKHIITTAGVPPDMKFAVMISWVASKPLSYRETEQKIVLLLREIAGNLARQLPKPEEL
jgi:ribonuclease P protein component